MTRFNDDNVAKLARQAYRRRADDPEEEQLKAKKAAPLIGKEARLLAALREAEQAYDEWLELAPCLKKVRQLIANFPDDCDKLKGNLKPLLACWSAMSQYGGQNEIACRVPNLETREEVTAFIRRVDGAMETLRQLLIAAESGSDDERFSYRGNPGGKSKSSDAPVAALKEFTKVVRAFWVEEVPDAFSFQQVTLDQIDGRLVASSPAARLMEGAAKILDERYNLGNVRQAMQTVRRDHKPY